jgi:molybdopterin synthase catalytic subunit
MTIRVQQEIFDPWRELAEYETVQAERLTGQSGAAVVFVGRMRDFSHGTPVVAMQLEHYSGMTEAYLEKISIEARTRWELLDTLIIHRFGPLQPDDPIVLVAAWSAHRDAAFAAARYLIDELKTRAPFWKQEQTPAGTRWVQPD